MGLLEKLLEKMLKAKPGFEEKIIRAAEKVNNGGTAEDIDTVVNDYYQLIKKVHKKNKPRSVELTKYSYLVLIDGIEYDFSSLIHHNDQRNTERKCEIEVLRNGAAPLTVIQERLNRKIGDEW